MLGVVSKYILVDIVEINSPALNELNYHVWFNIKVLSGIIVSHVFVLAAT